MAGWHGDMESAPRFPYPHIPQELLRTNVQRSVTLTLYTGTKDRLGHQPTSPIDLLALATHSIVPIHESTLGIVPPGPDVQFEERIDVETIREADKVEDLPVQYRSGVVIGGVPARRVQNELDAYKDHLAIDGLVDEGLRLRGVEGEIPQQGAVDVVHSHRPVVGAGDATKEWSVARCGRVVDVDVLARSFANKFHQPG